MNVYQSCPVFENSLFCLRLLENGDTDDLLKVYSDERAVPFFNSDNCHGDDFHYTTRERMQQAVNFWQEAYEKGWFVRWSVVNKSENVIVGSIECFRRNATDYFTNCALLWLDLSSDYEQTETIESILSLFVPAAFQLFGADKIATKAVPTAEKRIAALQKLGFSETNEKLLGFDGTPYENYFVLTA